MRGQRTATAQVRLPDSFTDQDLVLRFRDAATKAGEYVEVRLSPGEAAQLRHNLGKALGLPTAEQQHAQVVQLVTHTPMSLAQAIQIVKDLQKEPRK